MKDRNIFAYTAPGGPYPEYVSINRVDGEIYISVRSPDGGPTAKMRLPADRLDEMIYALRGARPANLRAGSGVSPNPTDRPCGECHLKPGEVCDICGRSLKIERPKGCNADEWHLFVLEYRSAPEFLAVQIGEALDSKGRDDARDRFMFSISDALIRLLRDLPGQEQIQIRHNLAECCRDLLAAAGLEHGRPSGWQNQINKPR